MKRHIEEIMVYDNYTMEEVNALMKKQYPGESSFTFDVEVLETIMTLMNELQKIYGAEDNEIKDDDLFMEAVMFVYHMDELKKLVQDVCISLAR